MRRKRQRSRVRADEHELFGGSPISTPRLREVLVLGNGTAQTNLGWDEEVDFGRQQLELTAKGPGYETYNVPCDNGGTWAVRCEFGKCRVLAQAAMRRS